MSESGLSVGFPELQSECGYYLGYGRTHASWTAAQLAEVLGIVNSGVRRVYYPPAINAQTVGYEWSFLRPTTTLSITVEGGCDYDLPDDFGRLVGVFHYAAAEYRNPISIISVSRLLDLRASSDTTGSPTYAAIRYKASTGSAGQKQEVLFFPTPDASKTLSYEYEAYNGALSDSYPYPLGGMQLAELYIESCLAIAETRINDEIGQHAQQFQALLVDAIARDRKRGAQMYGHMGNVEEETEFFRRGYTGSVYPITYGGETI
jgi:hypothetical protein